jgi:hypothetical protein
LRDQFVKLFTPAELAELDAIPTYADALSFAHTAVLAASQPLPPLHNLFARATELRDLLMSDATALANRGIIDAKVIADLKGGTGYLAVAYDLGAIVHLLRERWSDVSKRSAISELDVKEAENLYEQVTRAFAERERQSDAVTAATADRARAYTLFVNAYDQLRRAAMFVRWQQGDADKFVPSLYAGRGGRGNVVKAPVQTTTATEAVAKAGAAGAGAAPAAPAPAVEAPSEPGMPGGSPFSS